MKKDVIAKILPDACKNPGAVHENSSYLAKQASGKEDRRSPALAGNGKLMERMRKRIRKDCIS